MKLKLIFITLTISLIMLLLFPPLVQAWSFLGLGTGANPDSSLKSLEATFSPKWISAYEVKILDRYSVNQTKKVLLGPDSAWRTLLQIQTLENQAQSDRYCLIYRFPKSKISKLIKIAEPNSKFMKLDDPSSEMGSRTFGELKIVRLLSTETNNQHNRDCSSVLLEPSEDKLINIYSLNLWVTGSQEDKFEDQLLKPYHFYIFGEIFNPRTSQLHPFKLEFPLYNLKKGRAPTIASSPLGAPTINRPWNSAITQKLIPGATFYPLINSDEIPSSDQPSDRLRIVTNLPMGDIKDNYSKGTAIRCDDQCDRCRYGWYEVITRNSLRRQNDSGAKNRYCGIDNCGSKNQPACPRGNGSVFCAQELVSSYDRNGVLICVPEEDAMPESQPG